MKPNRTSAPFTDRPVCAAIASPNEMFPSIWNPRYISTVTIIGSTAPSEPNWARLWIICGSPIRGPWTEW